jgi:CheY-like chemotaxis protein
MSQGGHARGTVLLVDDDGGVRLVTRLALRAAGYRVLAAGTGAEALALCARHAGPVHHLVADVRLPDTTGPRLAEAVRALRPGVRVLFFSGYPREALGEHERPPPGGAFLAKPFTLVGLVDAVGAAWLLRPR